jgi:hypothetical protein
MLLNAMTMPFLLWRQINYSYSLILILLILIVKERIFRVGSETGSVTFYLLKRIRIRIQNSDENGIRIRKK